MVEAGSNARERKPATVSHELVLKISKELCITSQLKQLCKFKIDGAGLLRCFWGGVWGIFWRPYLVLHGRAWGDWVGRIWGGLFLSACWIGFASPLFIRLRDLALTCPVN